MNPLKDAIDQRGDLSEDGVVHNGGQQAPAMARHRSSRVGEVARGGSQWPEETSGGQIRCVVKDLDWI